VLKKNPKDYWKFLNKKDKLANEVFDINLDKYMKCIICHRFHESKSCTLLCYNPNKYVVVKKFQSLEKFK